MDRRAFDSGSPNDSNDPDEFESLWLATTRETDYTPLEDRCSVDVAVVGGGITGLTTAINLKEAGRRVAVLEADRISSATTGNTTAKLTSQHGQKYKRLCSSFGRKRAKQYADANESAIEEVEMRLEELNADAGFERTPAYVYAESSDDAENLREEADIARKLGLPASFTRSIDAPFEVAGALRFDDQAQFHPREYLLAVADAVDGDGSHVFEGTKVVGIDDGSPCRVETEQATVIADDVVVASNFPAVDRAGYFARMHPSRAYLLAVELADELPEGMYLGSSTPPFTFRPYSSEDERLLIVGGQSHSPSLERVPTSERYRRCEEFARERFDVESIRYRWSARDYVSLDGVPFIGRLGPTTDHVYVGTGFSKWGMTGGTAAGMILSELIVHGSNRWADVFDPMRFSLSSGSTFLEKNATVAARWVGDRAKQWVPLEAESEMPKKGSGAVVRRNGRPVAVYRTDSGELHAFSAVCPHLWCLVDWNDAERTWDCPCHGSRFDCDGTVTCGPATNDLASREL